MGSKNSNFVVFEVQKGLNKSDTFIHVSFVLFHQRVLNERNKYILQNDILCASKNSIRCPVFT